MKTLKIYLLSLILISISLFGEAIIYEGFDMTAAKGTPLASEGAKHGATSQGWLSDWHIKEGESKILKQDLALNGLRSSTGLIASQGKTVAMRQISESFTGDVFGSFRVRASKLNPNSMMGLLIGLPDADPINPKTSFVSFLVSRWASDLGGISIAGKPIMVDDGVGLKDKQTALVLWKIENLPKLGEKSNQSIQMWILNEDQVAHYSQNNFQEKLLKAAKSGEKSTEVMQYVKVDLKGSKLFMTKGLIVSCFSMGVAKADFDEIRITSESLAEAAGTNLN